MVNIGDLYEDMTNGRWMSTVHRVRAPEPGTEAASQGRWARGCAAALGLLAAP